VFAEVRPVGTADKKVEGTGLGLALSKVRRAAPWPNLGRGPSRRRLDVSRSPFPDVRRTKPFRYRKLTSLPSRSC
jgi:hypothetical protein